MKRTSIIYLFLGFTCLPALDAYSQQVRLISPEKIERLDSFLQVMAANGLFNGSVLVSKNGRVAYKRSAGYYNFEQRISNATNTPFNLASASKPLTATAILQLVEKGKLRVDDRAASYLPGFPYKNITIKNLLTHTSGLPRIEDIEKDYANSHPLEIITNSKAYRDLIAGTDSLMVKPGERFQYTNTNYFLLSLIVEKITGMTFANYMAKEIFKPAGMKNTFIRQGKNTNTPRYVLPTMYATNYQHVDSLDKNKYYTYFQLGGLTGPNNVISTLEDLLLFDNALNEGKLVDMKLLNEALTPALLNNGKSVSLGGVRTYGYGWNIMNEPVRDKVVFHDGHIVGLTTMIYRNPIKNISIFYYDNADAKGPFTIVATVSRIVNDEPLNAVSLKKSAVRVFGQVLAKNGLGDAKTKLEQLMTDSVHYYFDELEMNALGYDLLSKGFSPDHKSLSLEVFRMNMQFFPGHPNVYDSYGDALLENGQKEEAIRMFKKVIELDPKHESAKEKLKKLSS